MKITSSVYDTFFKDTFYKATASSVQVCNKVRDYKVGEPSLEGYTVDSLFNRIRYVEGVPIYADLTHFDSPNQGFFSTEEEAIALHRELVLNYIRGLNASSLKTCPIDIPLSNETVTPKPE
jgi:hypothetical protein